MIMIMIMIIRKLKWYIKPWSCNLLPFPGYNMKRISQLFLLHMYDCSQHKVVICFLFLDMTWRDRIIRNTSIEPRNPVSHSILQVKEIATFGSKMCHEINSVLLYNSCSKKSCQTLGKIKSYDICVHTKGTIISYSCLVLSILLLIIYKVELDWSIFLISGLT